MNSPSKLNSYEVDNIFPKESIAPSVKDNKTANFFQPKVDIFDEIMKELENAKSPVPPKSPKNVISTPESQENKENIDSNNIKNIPQNNPSDINDIELQFSKNKSVLDKDDTQFIRMKKLREGLQNQPHFDFGIPLNEKSSLSIIQKFKEKKETSQNFEKILRKINILKWMKVYTILMNKEIQSINLCLNQLKKTYSFDSGNSSVLCEVKNLFIIDCYQLLDVIDANFVTKKIILTKNVKKNPNDKGKIKILYEYYVNIGDLILFKRPLLKPEIVYGEEFLELDIKDIQKIVTF